MKYLLTTYEYNRSKENGYSSRHHPILIAEHDTHPYFAGDPLRYLIQTIAGTYVSCDTIDEALSELTRLYSMTKEQRTKEMLEALGYNYADFTGKKANEAWHGFRNDQYVLWCKERDARKPA